MMSILDPVRGIGAGLTNSGGLSTMPLGLGERHALKMYSNQQPAPEHMSSQ